MSSEVQRSSVSILEGKLDPQNAAELMEMARFIAKSNLKPRGLNTAEDCFLVMFYGQAYGFHPAVSLQKLVVSRGKVSAPGETCAGLIQSHPLCRDFRVWNEGEGEERSGCVQSWRKGRDRPNEVIRFTLANARRAGLYDESWRDRNGDPSPWVKYTDDMLIWKAVARDQRRNWADVTGGLQVLEDMPREERRIDARAMAIPDRGPDPLLKQISPGSSPESEIDLEPREPEVEGATEGAGEFPEQHEDPGREERAATPSVACPECGSSPCDPDCSLQGEAPPEPLDPALVRAIRNRVERLVESRQPDAREELEARARAALKLGKPLDAIAKALADWRPS